MAQPRSDINITPLIDIVLVLLIVFITMVPGMVRAWEVRLPGEGGGTRDRAPLKVSLDAAGQLSLEGQPVELPLLRARIQAEWKDVKAGQRKAIIRVAPELPFQRVTPVLDLVKSADPKSSVALLNLDA